MFKLIAGFVLYACSDFFQDHEMEMIPILIEPMETLSRCSSQVKVIDATKDFRNTVIRVCRAVVTYHKFQRKMEHIFNEVDVSIVICGTNCKSLFNQSTSADC